MGWTARFLHPVEDPQDDNADVVVTFDDGRTFGATVFTLTNVDTLMRRWSTTGECASGAYFWAETPILVRTLDQATLDRVVADLVATGEFASAFAPLDHPNDHGR